MYASLYAAAQDLLFWSLGVAMMGHGTAKLDWKRMINPSLVGILLAGLLVLTGVPVPEFLMKTASTVGAATLPLSLLVVGAGFHGVHLGRDTLRALLPVAGLKLVLVPAIMAVLLSLIPMAPVAARCWPWKLPCPARAGKPSPWPGRMDRTGNMPRAR
jgi:predicted permease